MTNKVSLITGGASGIGLATAKRLIADGWRIGVLDVDEDAVSQAADDLGADHACGLVADVRDEQAVADAVEALMQRWGRIDGLVNSAGIAREVKFEDTDMALMRQVLDINLMGTFIVTKAAFAHMHPGSSIVNIASVSGERGNVGRTAYGTSKAAIIQMTKIWASEFAERGIRVNGVSPGPVDTPLAQKLHSQEVRDEWARMIPLARYAEAEEIAEPIVFLMSDGASYINGHILAVDGGFLSAGISITSG